MKTPLQYLMLVLFVLASSMACVSASIIDIAGYYSWGGYWTFSSPRTGTFGFEFEIGNKTEYWIAPSYSIDSEITEKALSYTTSLQEVALLVLETKASGGYSFHITHEKLFRYVNGVKTGYGMDYNLYFNDGSSANYQADSTQTIDYIYQKNDNYNMKSAIGSFVVELNNLASAGAGSYRSMVTVELVSQ